MPDKEVSQAVNPDESVAGAPPPTTAPEEEGGGGFQDKMKELGTNTVNSLSEKLHSKLKNPNVEVLSISLW